MSKRKKVLLKCPNCNAHLCVKRSLFKVSNHPIYEKKDKLIINYSKSVLTEDRRSKLWLKCINCNYSQLFKNENELKEAIVKRLGGQLAKNFRIEQTSSQKREAALPKIVKPSKMLYNPETNEFYIPDLRKADAVT